MKNRLLTTAFALTVVLLACSMTVFDGFTPRQIGSIERGMSVKEVKDILGDPVLRDIDEDEEVWTFRSTDDDGVMEIRIWFRDGKVARMRTHDGAPADTPHRRPALRHHRHHGHPADSCCYGYPCGHYPHRGPGHGGCCR